jgi:hypothetical protein
MGPGTSYIIEEEEGLETVSVRSGTRPAPRAAGSIPGLHVADSKRIILKGWINGTSVADTETKWMDMRAVMVPSESEQHQYLFRHIGGVDRFVWARLIDRPTQRNADTETVGLIPFVVGFEVADPRIYSVEQHSETIPIFSTGFPGVDFPLNFPVNWDSGSQATASLFNAGDQDAYPLCRFQFTAGGTGDFDGVELTNLTNGAVLTINTSLTAGQVLEANMDAYVRAVADNLIIYIGSSSRFGDWAHPRELFYLSPGFNELTFEVLGSSPTSDAACSVLWHDTSL